jgi:hypothetical protein
MCKPHTALVDTVHTRAYPSLALLVLAGASFPTTTSFVSASTSRSSWTCSSKTKGASAHATKREARRRTRTLLRPPTNASGSRVAARCATSLLWLRVATQAARQRRPPSCSRSRSGRRYSRRCTLSGWTLPTATHACALRARAWPSSTAPRPKAARRRTTCNLKDSSRLSAD